MIKAHVVGLAAASVTAGLFWSVSIAGAEQPSTVSLVDTVPSAGSVTAFSVFGAGGGLVDRSHFVGPRFVLSKRTTLTEIGGYLNNCVAIVSGTPQCPETKPLVVQIRRAKNGVPNPQVLLASFELSHDNDPLTVSYESASPHLKLSPGTYFALFGTQQDQDGGFLLGSASTPFSFTASTTILGYIDPGRVFVGEVPAAVRILGRIVGT